MHTSSWLLFRVSSACFVLACATGCSSNAADDPAAPRDAGSAADAGTSAARLGLSCDFLNHTLSIVDLGALAAGATRHAALIAEIDLRAYAAGPLDAEIVPGTHLALVSLSAGFFSLPGAGSVLIGASAVPSDPGKLLFVDLDEREVVGELDTGRNPMGIAITPDGARAFVAHFSDSHVAVVDVAARTVLERVMVGPYSEEIAFDDGGEVGIFSYSAAGNVRTFATSDLASSLSPPLELSGDAAGVAFFPGTKTAYVVQAPNPLTGAKGGHTVVDVRDASAPALLEDVRDDAAPVAYPAVAVAARGTIAVPVVASSMLSIQELALRDDGTVELVQSIDAGASGVFGAYSAAVDVAGRVLMAVPGQRKVLVVDLDTAEVADVPWDVDDAGPTDLIPIPRER